VKKIVELLALRGLEQALCHDYFLVRYERIRLETVRDFFRSRKKLELKRGGFELLSP
jgi:hypothetical protein